MKKVVMRSKKGITVAEAFNHFIRKCTARNLSKNSIDIYKVRLQVFLRFLNDDTLLVSAITKDTIDDYTLHLKGSESRNDITVNSYLRDLRVLLYFCMDEGYISLFKIKLPKVDKPLQETYTDAELKKVLKKPNVKTCNFTEYKIWVLTNYLIATGNRISSAINLKIADLDFDNAVIQVNKNKNRKAQIIPMSATLSSVLKEYLVYRNGERGIIFSAILTVIKGISARIKQHWHNIIKIGEYSKHPHTYIDIHLLRNGF